MESGEMKRRMTFAEERAVIKDTLELVCRFLREHNSSMAERELRTMGFFWILRQRGYETSSQSLKQESALRQPSQVAEIKNDQGTKTNESKAVVA